MGKRKQNPAVKIMVLFSELNESEKAVVADWVKSQTAAPRKAVVKKGGKKQEPLLTPAVAISGDASGLKTYS